MYTHPPVLTLCCSCCCCCCLLVLRPPFFSLCFLLCSAPTSLTHSSSPCLFPFRFCVLLTRVWPRASLTGRLSYVLSKLPVMSTCLLGCHCTELFCLSVCLQIILFVFWFLSAFLPCWVFLEDYFAYLLAFCLSFLPNHLLLYAVLFAVISRLPPAAVASLLPQLLAAYSRSCCQLTPSAVGSLLPQSGGF